MKISMITNQRHLGTCCIELYTLIADINRRSVDIWQWHTSSNMKTWVSKRDQAYLVNVERDDLHVSLHTLLLGVYGCDFYTIVL